MEAVSTYVMSPSPFNPGESARVRHSIHSPYPGQTGIVLNYDPSDKRGSYLLMFSNGLQFRYKQQELETLDRPAKPRVLESLFKGLHIW